MKLYNYWRSSSSWRVRLALHLKSVSFQYVAVNLLQSEQLRDAHRARNPLGAVPVLELDDGTQLSQSVAIVEFLEETFPAVALLPSKPKDRAFVRTMVELVNSGIQPFQNLSFGRYVKDALKGDDKAVAKHFVTEGLTSLEKLATVHSGQYLFGDSVTLADCYLTPQLYSARRFGVDVAALFPTLGRIENQCRGLPAFAAADPANQPDAQSTT